MKNEVMRKLCSIIIGITMFLGVFAVNSQSVVAAELGDRKIIYTDGEWSYYERFGTEKLGVIQVGDTLTARYNSDNANGDCYSNKLKLEGSHTLKGTVVKIEGNSIYICSSHQYTRDGEICTYCGIFKGTPHEHSFAEAWSSNSTDHYHACTAEGNSDSCLTAEGAAKAAHSGGTATCTTKATCSVCRASYGELDSSNHSFATTWTYDETNHWHAATCGHTAKSGEVAHSGGTATCTTQAVCSVCGTSYGELDSSNHSFATAWTYDKTNHWHAASCGHTVKSGEAAHTLGEWVNGVKSCTCGYKETCTHDGATKGTCSICGKDLGSPTPTPSPASKSESTKSSESARVEVVDREAVEEKMPVSPVSVDMTQFNKADSSVVPGTTYNLSNFVTTTGIVKGINAAVAASNKSGSNTATIYSGKPLCFNTAIVKAIQNGKKTVVYYFPYKGHIYSVTIPATVEARYVLERSGFAGPFYVGQQLGTTKLVK